MEPSTNKPAPRRVVSLLPSATEHFAALVSAAARLGHTSLPELVGRSHECDFPTSYASIPTITKPRTTFTSCEDTHNQVVNLLQSDDSLYEIDAATLTNLAPDLILVRAAYLFSFHRPHMHVSYIQVQDVCNVCSIDRPTVSCAMASNPNTEILLVNSRTLANALEDSVRLLGKALHLEDAAEAVVAANRARQTALTVTTQTIRRPIVYIVEWMEPLFLAKGWADEMVALVGGQAPVTTGRIADPSVLEPPDLIVVALCGLDRHTTVKELRSKPFPPWWRSSPAVQAGTRHVFVVDGNQMFNRPTNRLLDAMEWLGVVVANPHHFNSIQGFPVDAFDSDAAAPPILSEIEAAIVAAHAAACAANQARYNDPATGYGVFTSAYLLDRQACCGNRCRHCPYGHANVPLEQLHLIKSKNTMTSSVFLRPPKPSATGRLGYRNPKPVKGAVPRDVVVVFWSGGKDSLLALLDTIDTLDRSAEDIVLLTTFNPDEGVVPVQNIDVRTIVAQAAAINLPLFLVAVPTGGNYAALVHDALSEIPGMRMPHVQRVVGLVVGDLHLADVHEWRVAAFPTYDMRSPLWGRDMRTDLLPKLAAACDKYKVTVRYSAVDTDRMPPTIREGDAYEPHLVPGTVDAMGENGEFHTVVEFV
ncbi:hypothetical protein B5M09_010016 [Aphanomyces astaci]|uniref:Diphthine--ammonia ligase n=1 Tax=Aphanomyces astaci TaxID=112090 RepID=A0A425DNA7_APHAT|nr:hypothetical protein B5M09_010016 [Aphanomyces astaci]